MPDTETTELITLLNSLLEAERAGAQVAARSGKETNDANVRELMAVVGRDESRFCAMLVRNIERLGATPTKNVGDFLERCMAIPDMGERLDFLNRGQGWVAKRLRELIPSIDHDDFRKELEDMLEVHVLNIDTANQLRATLN